MKFENTEVMGMLSALRGMRNPMNSWSRGDSMVDNKGSIILGDNDRKTVKALCNAPSDSDSKFLRMIYVTTDITAPVYWWREMDQYKVATTTDSCSMQHKGASRDFTLDDLAIDIPGGFNDNEKLLREYTALWQGQLDTVNFFRKKFLETKDYTYFRIMRQFMPMGYEYKETWSANYAVIRNIVRQRKNHKLSEWHEFCDWAKTLPYADLMIFNEEK